MPRRAARAGAGGSGSGGGPASASASETTPTAAPTAAAPAAAAHAAPSAAAVTAAEGSTENAVHSGGSRNSRSTADDSALANTRTQQQQQQQQQQSASADGTAVATAAAAGTVTVTTGAAAAAAAAGAAAAAASSSAGAAASSSALVLHSKSTPHRKIERPFEPRLLMEDDADAVPKRIASIQFGLLSAEEITKLSEIQVVNRELYPHLSQIPARFGCLDRRLGVSEKAVGGQAASCETCGLKLADCAGHFGYVRLELPVYHVGYFKAVLNVLQCICKTCSRVLLSEPERSIMQRKLRNPRAEALQRKAMFKAVTDKCKRVTMCPYCGATNGVTKKVGQLHIRHERLRARQPTGGRRGGQLSEEREAMTARYEKLLAAQPDLRALVQKNATAEDLSPLHVQRLLEAIPDDDCELLDMNLDFGRPEDLLMTRLLVPPVCIRPSVRMDAAGSNEDDLTMKLSEILNINNHLRLRLEQGARVSDIVDLWECLQMQCAVYINSETPGSNNVSSKTGKMLRGFCQRLKGKTGRFRGNLSGKRVDFSGRTVISPDPNLGIRQVGLPVHVCKTLTYPERVNEHNLKHMQQLVLNGPHVHPGANHVNEAATGYKIDLRFGDRKQFARRLRVGDVVERHLIDNDVVLFNRQPSLHKLSIMCHEVKVMPWRTFRFNECACPPYNADFDGDEMNVHVPQTEEARAEALMLMSVVRNIITPRNGEPLIAATQDFLTCAYLLTRRDVFFTRSEFCQLCAFMFSGVTRFDVPPPTVLKPRMLWTGKQLLRVLLAPNARDGFFVNVELKERNIYGGSGDYMDPQDGYVFMVNSELLTGILGKSSLGGGSKSSIFFSLIKHYGFEAAAECMGRLTKLCSRFLGNRGFSIGITDVMPSQKLTSSKETLILHGYGDCDKFIADLDAGHLQRQAGFDEEATLESMVTGRLSQLREEAGQLCIKELPWFNSPLIMALCGSKGSVINISQMIACVGQQTVSGLRIPNGFVHRTLPHFARNSRIPAAKGFVRNSFFTGLTPTEFFFHTMGGREGLVDTAVKTAETGYMQRRLMKALEDLSVQYDGTVRTSSGTVVQFCYGDDGLDPSRMEAKDGRPIDFDQQWKSVVASRPAGGASSYLLPFEVIVRGDHEIEQRKAGIEATSRLVFNHKFVGELRAAVQKLASTLATTREQMKLKRLDSTETESLAANVQASAKEDPVMRRAANLVSGVTDEQLAAFVQTSLERFVHSCVQPGEAVGAVGAQSIGEPGTQMTLKTFHFAGVASMNVTLGVPRIKEIINAAKNISTPIVSAALQEEKSEPFARGVRGRIERTTLGDVAEYIREEYEREACRVTVKVSKETLSALHLDVGMTEIASCVRAQVRRIRNDVHANEAEYTLTVAPAMTSTETLFFDMRTLRETLQTTVISGIPLVDRAVITVREEAGICDNKLSGYQLLVEGNALRQVMGTPGVVGTRTSSNHIMEVESVLGIEAVRRTIIHEIQYTMGKHGMSIDSRHVQLLADVMTYRGEVLGITRFGMAKMKDSVMLLASFEKTTDHLFEAAAHTRRDSIDGVSERIIMGESVPLGTGLFSLLDGTPSGVGTVPPPAAAAAAAGAAGAPAAASSAAAAAAGVRGGAPLVPVGADGALLICKPRKPMIDMKRFRVDVTRFRRVDDR